MISRFGLRPGTWSKAHLPYSHFPPEPAARPSGRRCYNFASDAYHQAFESRPKADSVSMLQLRQETLKYLSTFNPHSWTEDPICTVVDGVKYAGGSIVDTVDALGAVNGRQILADAEAERALVAKLLDYARPWGPHQQQDLRNEVRRIEMELISPQRAAALVGNQLLDFKKQDGVTEIEEAIEASAVERVLNDQLLMDEQLGRVQIRRAVAIIMCVNNFSNFLDLFRKARSQRFTSRSASPGPLSWWGPLDRRLELALGGVLCICLWGEVYSRPRNQRRGFESGRQKPEAWVRVRASKNTGRWACR